MVAIHENETNKSPMRGALAIWRYDKSRRKSGNTESLFIIVVTEGCFFFFIAEKVAGNGTCCSCSGDIE